MKKILILTVIMLAYIVISSLNDNTVYAAEVCSVYTESDDNELTYKEAVSDTELSSDADAGIIDFYIKKIGGYGIGTAIKNNSVIYNARKKTVLYKNVNGPEVYEIYTGDNETIYKGLLKKKVKGKVKYYYYEGNDYPDFNKSNEITAKKYKKLKKSSWAITEKTKGSKKLKILKNNDTNRKKLAVGKIMP